MSAGMPPDPARVSLTRAALSGRRTCLQFALRLSVRKTRAPLTAHCDVSHEQILERLFGVNQERDAAQRGATQLSTPSRPSTWAAAADLGPGWAARMFAEPIRARACR